MLLVLVDGMVSSSLCCWSVVIGVSVCVWGLCCFLSRACICMFMSSLVRFNFCDVSCFLFAVLVVDCSWSSRVRSLDVRYSMSFWVLLMSVLVLFKELVNCACVVAVVCSELYVLMCDFSMCSLTVVSSSLMISVSIFLSSVEVSKTGVVMVVVCGGVVVK